MVPMPFLSKHLEGESPVEMLGVSIDYFFKGIKGVCRVREGLNEKKMFSFGHCPNDGGGAQWANLGGEAT